MTLELWTTGFIHMISNPQVIMYLAFGIVAGAVIGALPGLSSTMGIAILTPLTFWLDADCGFAMLIGVWNSSVWAGGISAIIINTPGTPGSIASSFDGYKLYKQGRGGLALGVNVIYSVLGGLLSTIALIFFAWPLARFAVTFGPPEYFALALFGLSMMVSVSGNSVMKGLAVGLAGLLLSTVGMDPIMASPRYTLGITYLQSGIQFLPIMIGMFGIGEVLSQIYDYNREQVARENELKKQNMALGRVLPNKQEIKQLALPTFLSGLLSIIIGIIPAAGGDIASIICWGQGKKLSKHGDEYGNGSLEGMAVSTISNNGVLGGALITMLTMGIPGDSVTAILIGSLMMYGMTPGVKMFNEQPDFIVNIMLLMIFANLFILILGLLTAKASAKVLNVKPQSVWVAVSVLCVVGSYALNNSFNDVLIMFAAAILGFFFKRADFPSGPFILGLLLGNMLESNFRRALILSGGNLNIFFKRPVTCILLVVIVFTLMFPSIKRIISERPISTTR